MMFETVAVGDTVLQEVMIPLLGWHDKRCVYVEAKVEKVTKTQLTVNGTRYTRMRGEEFGDKGDYNNRKPRIMPVGYIHHSKKLSAVTDDYIGQVQAGVASLKEIIAVAADIGNTRKEFYKLLDQPERLAEIEVVAKRLKELLKVKPA